MDQVDQTSRAVLPRLYERDIDVVLQEELLFNRKVLDLFSDALALPRILQAERCELSVVAEAGETDVLLTASLDGLRVSILIENKIDAAFQSRQPERYRERAERLVADAQCARAFCVLVSPRGYVSEGDPTASLFDARISYESLAEAIEAEQTPRARHRSALIRHAISVARSSYAMTPSPEATALWRRIFEIADRAYPALAMKLPGEKGSSGYWVLFKADLPKNISIDWKMTTSVVDLSFWADAPHKPVHDIDLSDLRRPAGCQRVGASVVIRTPTLPPAGHWTQITDEHIAHALEAANDLYVFYRQHPDFFA